MVNMKLIAGIGFAACTGLYFGCYYGKQNAPGMDMLKGTSAYVQQYKGENPSEALNYAKLTLELVGKKNPNLQKITYLEEEIYKINDEIGNSTNPNIYKPVLLNVGNKMKGIVRDNTRYQGYFWIALLCGLVSIVYLADPRTWRDD
jgi:hypothetical protein